MLEDTNNELNVSNKDMFLQQKDSKNIIKNKSDLKDIKIHQTVLMEDKVKKEGKVTLNDLGKIEEAKKHRSANRPLHKIKDFNNNVNFCRCCSLPCEEKGIIEPFKMCDNIDDFSECGLGVTLYFYFFRFAIIVIFIGIGVMAISMMVFNHHYTKGINRVCNNYYIRYHKKQLNYCSGFITVSNESYNNYTRFNDWILRFTSDNMKVYQLLHRSITGTKNTRKVLINYSVLNFFFLLTILILNIFFIIFLTAQSQKAKLLNLSIRDYTVLISNSKHILIDYLNTQERENPKFIKNSQQLVENTADFIAYVNEYIRYDRSLIDLKINNINMCYNLGIYIDLRDEYEECVKKIFKIKNDPKIIELNLKNGNLFQNRHYYKFPLGFIGMKCCYIKEKPLLTLQKQKLDLEKQLEFESENIQIISEKNFTGYMFLSFNRIKDKEIILERYPNKFFDMMIYYIKNIKYYLCCCCLTKGEKIKFNKIKGVDVEDPPEPEDLFWENFKYSSRNRACRIILVFVVCLVIIGVSLLIVLGFTVLQNNITKDEKKINLFLKYLLSFAITIVISVIDAVLSLVLEKLTFLEKHLSRSNYQLSLSIKLTLFTFFNSGIIPLVSKHLIVDKRVNLGNFGYNIDRNNLLVNDMFVLFLVNAVVAPLLWTFNIMYIFHRIKIYFLEKRKDPDENHFMTQRELNKLYELPDMKIAYKFSYIGKTLALTVFYLPIFPMGFIISCFGLFFGYILELFNFTHLYKRPEMLDEIIAKVFADNFIIIIFIGAIGDYFFFHEIFPDNKMSLANIIIFGILIIIPYSKFINCNFVGIDKSEYHNFPLSDVYFTFYNDYQRQNPFTKKVGMIKYLTELKKNGYLSENAYKLAESNIENLNLMEIYYGITKGDIPIIHQSAMANTHNNKSIACQNIRQSLVAPNIHDGFNDRVQKQKYFDSQILNMFGSKEIKNVPEAPINFPMDTIVEEEEKNEKDDNETKDKLVNAYNNPLGINMGLGPLPMEDYLNTMPLTKSLRRTVTKNTNDKNNNLKFFKDFEEEKNNERNIDNNRSDKDRFIDVKMSNNKKSIVSSKIDDKDGNKSSLPFHSSFNSSNPEINKLQNNGENNNNQSSISIQKNEYNDESKEEEKNKDVPYTSVMSQIQNNINMNENMDNNEFNTIVNNENDKYSDNFNINNFNDSSNINDSNNNDYDNKDHFPRNTSIKGENKNDTHSLNENNFNNIFNSSSKKIRRNKSNNFNQDGSINKLNDMPLDEESIKNKSSIINSDIKNNIKFSEGEGGNNIDENGDIKDIHNFPYNTENNNNNNNQNLNEDITPDLINNTNKTNNSNFQIDTSNENENDDYI